MDTRADVDADFLLKVVLVLVIAWIGLEILETLTDILEGLFDVFKPVLGLLVVVLIVLWLLDRL
ncbi:MAG: hypothetical protein ABEJ85_05845 [Haloarculaceae archaeon]